MDVKELPSVSQTDRTEAGSLPASTAATDVLHLCFAATTTAAESCPASCQASGQRLQNLPSKRKRFRDNLPQEDFGSKSRGTKADSSRCGNIREACRWPSKAERGNTAAAARLQHAHPRARVLSPARHLSEPASTGTHKEQRTAGAVNTPHQRRRADVLASNRPFPTPL